jgi:hypothetical protein
MPRHYDPYGSILVGKATGAERTIEAEVSIWSELLDHCGQRRHSTALVGNQVKTLPESSDAFGPDE